MEMSEYQKIALSTRLDTASAAYAIINITSEVGELTGIIAKGIRDKTELDHDKIKGELGDILWHVAVIAKDFDLSLDEVALYNMEKLFSRKKRNKIKGSGDDR